MRNESAGLWRGLALALLLPVAAACGESASPTDSLGTAEAFMDAFYAFDRDRLAALVVPGSDADTVLYYQAWAEAAHYEVQKRQPCRLETEGNVVCAITVTDDFGSALGYTATDTFTLTVADDRIASVVFEGDDPPVFEAVFRWLQETRPEIFTGPCRDMFSGGTTPADCARAVAQGARDYAAAHPAS